MPVYRLIGKKCVVYVKTRVTGKHRFLLSSGALTEATAPYVREDQERACSIIDEVLDGLLQWCIVLVDQEQDYFSAYFKTLNLIPLNPFTVSCGCTFSPAFLSLHYCWSCLASKPFPASVFSFITRS